MVWICILLTREVVLYCFIDNVFREKAIFVNACKLFLVPYFPYNVLSVSSQ